MRWSKFYTIRFYHYALIVGSFIFYVRNDILVAQAVTPVRPKRTQIGTRFNPFKNFARNPIAPWHLNILQMHGVQPHQCAKFFVMKGTRANVQLLESREALYPGEALKIKTTKEFDHFYCPLQVGARQNG